MVLTVIYSPPGKTGGGSTSSVSYGAGSSLGSTVSSSYGFGTSLTVTATAEFTLASTNEVSISLSAAQNIVDSTSKDVRKTASTTFTVPGPANDGIDHDRDQIWLLLGPTLNVKITSPASITWTFDNSIVTDIQFVYVGHLKNPALMPPGVKARLEAYGITTSDYQEILKADPFATGTTSIDPNRYVSLNTTFPYEPPYAPGDPSTTVSHTVAHSTTTTATRTASQQYSVGVSHTGGLNFLNGIKAKLKIENVWTFTHTNSHSISNGTTESASVAIGGPSYGYTGPTDIAVYYDLVYKTFMFAPYESSFGPPLEGLVVSESGASVAGKEVEVVADGVTYRTFTNLVGEFRVYCPTDAAMQLRVGNTGMSVLHSGAPHVVVVP